MCLFFYAIGFGMNVGARAARVRTPLLAGAYNIPMDEANLPGEHRHAPAQPFGDGLDVLLARIASGDEIALAEFYDATVARVFGLARRITRNPQAAEEVVADVYLQVWQQASRYDATRGRVLTWLLTICRSRALDSLRRNDDAQSHPAPDTLRPDLYQDDYGPLESLLAFEVDSHVHSALASLNDVERKLVLLAFFEGMSHQQIADHTGMPLGSVKTVVRRSLLRMRGVMSLAPANEESA